MSMHLLHAVWITAARFSTALPKNQIEKLQHVQNSAARLVVNASRHDHIKPVLRELHWLHLCQWNSKLFLQFYFLLSKL